MKARFLYSDDNGIVYCTDSETKARERATQTWAVDLENWIALGEEDTGDSFILKDRNGP